MKIKKYLLVAACTLLTIIKCDDPFSDSVQSTASGIVANRHLLQRLLKSESSISSALQHYLEHETEKLSLIQWYLESYKNIEMANNNIENFLQHPINVYKAIDHFTNKWSLLKEVIELSSTDSYEILENIIGLRENFEGSRIDSYEAASSLDRLQVTYNLSINALVNGHLVTPTNHFKVSTNATTLNAYDCLQISLSSADGRHISEAETWLQVAEDKIQEGDTSTDLKFVNLHGDQLQNFETTSKDTEKYKNEMALRMKTDEEMKSYLHPDHDVGDAVENELFQRLCRGTKLMDESKARKLKCRLETRDVGFFAIHPLKIEDVSLRPPIQIVHNIVTNAEIDAFVNSTKSLDNEPYVSMVTDDDSPARVVDTYTRSGVNSWVGDGDNEIIKQVTKKLEYVSGLKASNTDFSAEPYQIAVYPPGGRYITHMDAFENSHRNHPDDPEGKYPCGDRLSTIMIYLSNVAAGGSTVFPLAGASVKPEKGSAVIWWNLDNKGEPDFWTRHGGCPVLYGSKWIANKWICYNPQFRNKPCYVD